ncbi:Peroxiredoxin [Thermodesulfobium acidiphilum]|uniref:Peroxiredoxin n=1 Tax=Thermodesulfobium acidiphilum TaxID=1794699 RepID=A0A2R4W1U7_THEAF|nr:redoxin domain-containing protein [Thermodesulfobium acidiphilum]AWB10714.1 Peroxiredoxin [Thermodesulfobium acidiphilum]
MLPIGSQAINFSLKDQNDSVVSLESLRGKNVLLSFHPLAFTPVCEEQMKSLEANFDTFKSLNTVCLGISIDSVYCKKAWADIIGVKNTSLLADFWPHGGLAQQYGVFLGDFGFSGRVNILLDESHKIIFKKIYPIKEVPDINEIIDFLKSKK